MTRFPKSSPQISPDFGCSVAARFRPRTSLARVSFFAGVVATSLVTSLVPAQSAGDEARLVPMPSGDGEPVAVGTQWLKLVDKSRDEVATKDGKDKRSLLVQLWYPAVAGKAAKGRKASGRKGRTSGASAKQAPKGSLAPYMPHFDVLAPALNPMFQAHAGPISELRVPARVEASAQKGKRMPLVIFSPGLGTIRLLYTSQILSLVSRGYIVAALDHSYDADGVVCPGPELCKRVDATGSESEGSPTPGKGLFAGPRLKVWTEDLRFVLGRVLALNKDKKSLLKGRIDTSKVAIVGHCFGARAALLAAAGDRRVKAVVLENPWPLAEESKSGKLAAKVLFAQGERIKEVVWLEKQGAKKADIDKLRQQVKAQQLSFLRALRSPVLRAEFADQEHMDFTDIPMLGAWIAAGAKLAPKRSERRDRIDGYIADYLDVTLLGRKGVDVRKSRSGIAVEVVKPAK